MPARKKQQRPEPMTITEPGAIKALAHPARLALLEELHHGEALTATEAAARVGMSPSALSYHLRALQRWGFVEPADDSGDGRERPWRATSPGGWRVRSSSEPVARAASSAALSVLMDRLRDSMLAWTEVEDEQPKAWQNAGTVLETSLWLTPAEAVELARHVDDLIDTARTRTVGEHPRGARKVRLGLVIAPAVD